MTASPSNDRVVGPVDELAAGVVDGVDGSGGVDRSDRLGASASDAVLWRLDPGVGLLGASRLSLGVKRAIDVVGSFAGLLVLLPLLAAVGLLIRLTSSGPALYVSTRVGVDGSEFRLLKFRSMYEDAEVRLPSLRALDETSGPVFKMKDDPRVTPVGRWIRKLSIDELPQLVNVLVGDMSLVGPRPPLPSEVATYTSLEFQRLSVKPGLTCVWQVSGRSDVDFVSWVKMDLEYIEGWSLRRDVGLIAKTVPVVVTGKGAY